MAIDHPLHVVVRFGSDVPSDVQGSAMLQFERDLRGRMPGKWVEVFKENKGDDSKLRMLMTKDQRDRL